MAGRFSFSVPERRNASDPWFRIGTLDVGTTVLVILLSVASMVLWAIGGNEIEYECGYADEPEDLPIALRLATLQIVASLYELRHGEAGIPQAARSLMRPFAPVRL